MDGSEVRTHISFLASRAKALAGELQSVLGVAYPVDMQAVLQGANMAMKLGQDLDAIAARPKPAPGSTVKP